MACARHCIIGAVQACLMCLAPARAQAQENPGFSDPAQAGFHNAALEYAESSLNAEYARPLFSRQDATGKATPSEPLFDAAKWTIDDQDRPALSIGPLEPVCRQFLNSCKNPIRIHHLCSSMSPWVGSKAGLYLWLTVVTAPYVHTLNQSTGDQAPASHATHSIRTYPSPSTTQPSRERIPGQAHC